MPPERTFLVLFFFFFVFHLTFRRTNPSNSFVRPKVLRTRTPDKNSMTGLRQFFFSVIFERKNYLKKSYQGFFLPSFLQKVKIQTKSESSIIFSGSPSAKEITCSVVIGGENIHSTCWTQSPRGLWTKWYEVRWNERMRLACF